MALDGRTGMGWRQTVVFNFMTGEDLCSGTYFDNAVPVVRLANSFPCRWLADMSCPGGGGQIDLQLAKQGFRLAAWLNILFDGATELP